MTVTVEPVRGQVVWVELPGVEGRKPYLVVSNNQRNRQLGDILGARVTTTRKPEHLRSVITLTPEDHPLVGSVLCDDIYPVFKDEIRAMWGAVTQNTMRRVEDGLRIALGLPS
jgi:mRNA interferase MazF